MWKKTLCLQIPKKSDGALRMENWSVQAMSYGTGFLFLKITGQQRKYWVIEMNDINRIRWLKEVFEIFDHIASHNEPYRWKSEKLDIEIDIFPRVFSPKYLSDSEWYADKVGFMAEGKSLLEVGSGTGLAAVWAGICGASRLAATDINPMAVKNTEHNLALHGLEAEVVNGDIYDGLSEKSYDIIFWNHPFNIEYEPGDIILRAAFDHDFNGLRKYVSEAESHLNENGRLLLGSANYAHPEKIGKIADESGYRLEIVCAENLPLFSHDSFKAELRLYEFVKK
ncbi:methyltransferase [Candidatus Woesearchaeota archaeon]|nr:methyltransferase [Candidatus Woesearchaeota archaeon]